MSADVLVLSEAVSLLRSGTGPEQVWDTLDIATTDGQPHLADAEVAAAVAAGQRLAHQTGAPLAGVLEAVMAHGEAQARLDSEISAALEGPRLSAVILQWLPLAGLGLATLIDPAALRITLTTPLGWVLAAVAAALTWAGRRWMRSQVMRARDVTREGEAGLTSTALVLRLLDAALSSGVDVPGALRATGAALRCRHGLALRHVANAVERGADWKQAWGPVPDSLDVVERALRHGWLHGADPQPFMEASLAQLERQARHDATHAVATLNVSLTFPLTLCFLPAFGLVGVLPMILAVAQSAAITLA